MPSPFDVQTSLKYVFSFKSTKWKREIIFKIFVSNKIISLLYNTTKFTWWGPFQQNKKQYQSILNHVTQNVSKPNVFQHFPSFWSKKNLALPALNGFPIPPFDVHLQGLPQTTITSRSGGRCRFFMRFSPFGFVSVLLDLELNRMPQITNPPNGTPVAFLWELNADSTKLCLIGLRVSSVNGIKILTSHFYILPY